MTAQPTWSPVDDETNNLLTLVADTDHPSVDFEWLVYKKALATAADVFGVIDPNALRPLLRGQVAPRRIGAFMSKALTQGLVAYTGRYVVSDDHHGGNAGKPCRELRLKPSSAFPTPTGRST